MRLLYHSLLNNRVVRSASGILAKMASRNGAVLTTQEIAIAGLSSAVDGLRVLHISDLHLRRDSEIAIQLPELAASVQYDLAMYTGDFIDGDDGIGPLAALLGRMPTNADSYAVLGNHDYWALRWTPRGNDVDRLRATLASGGIEVLCNNSQSVSGGALFIAGVDDPVSRRDDLDKAMSSVPAGASCLLLAHSPDIMLRLGRHRPSLVLSGHTHGGQVRLPIIGPAVNMTSLPRKLAMGYHRYRGIPLFVSRGVGYSGVDFRLRCPAEVALLTLRSVPLPDASAMPS